MLQWILSFSHWVMSDTFVKPWTAAHQAPLSMEFPRQEHWSGLPFPSPGDFPDPGIKPVTPALAGWFFTTEPLQGSPAINTGVHIFSYIYQFSSVQSSCSVMSDFLKPHTLQHARLPCPSPTHGAYSNSCPSHPLSSPSPPAFNLSQHQGLFIWVSSSYQVVKLLELQLQHQSFQLIFRTDFL